MKLPDLADWTPTRDTLHAYSHVVGSLRAALTPPHPRWWHASLRVAPRGLATGELARPGSAGPAFEVVLDLERHRLELAAVGRECEVARLDAGLAATEVGERALARLADLGLELAPKRDRWTDERPRPYERAAAGRYLEASLAVRNAFQAARAGFDGPVSPIQLWPHHFDLSVLWLPGEKIAGEDPADEESSDKQMNIGFAFGDDSVPEPYFYVTAYPAPDGMADTPLPAGAAWRTEGFTGATLAWRELLVSDGPGDVLQELWTRLVSAGRRLMLERRGSKR